MAPAVTQKQYQYDPSFAAAVIFLLFFIATTLFHLYQLLRTKTWYFIAFVVGGLFEIVGFGARSVNAKQSPDWSKGVFIIQSIGILLAPALFAASIYMEFGRIILLSDGERHSLVKRRWLTKLFVGGDVVSFLTQAGGGSILAKGDPKTANSGKTIIVSGLCIQVLFFGFFLASIINFWTRLRRAPTVASVRVPWQRHLTVFLSAGAIIMIRCGYRVIEYVQGTTGNLQSHEVYLYVLDAAPMLIVMLIFHYWHPSEVNALLKGGKVARLSKVHTVVQSAAQIPLNDVESAHSSSSLGYQRVRK